MPLTIIHCYGANSLGDLAACRAALVPVWSDVERSDPTGDSCECFTMVLQSQTQADYEFIRQDLLRTATGGRFPVFLANLSFDPLKIDRAFFDELLTRHGLVSFDETTSPGGVFLKLPLPPGE